MTESRKSFLLLPANEQADLLELIAKMLGSRPEFLEKDIWLCLAHGVLFDLPQAKPMAFKGGTSLSKVYRAIERFSEDIDVTIDYHSLISDSPDLAKISNKQLKKLSDRIKDAVAAHITQDLVPAFKQALALALPGLQIDIEVSEDAEKVWLYYPSVVDTADAYIRPSLLLEFGGRNATVPQERLAIIPDIAEHVPNLIFPISMRQFSHPCGHFGKRQP